MNSVPLTHKNPARPSRHQCGPDSAPPPELTLLKIHSTEHKSNDNEKETTASSIHPRCQCCQHYHCSGRPFDNATPRYHSCAYDMTKTNTKNCDRDCDCDRTYHLENWDEKSEHVLLSADRSRGLLPTDDSISTTTVNSLILHSKVESCHLLLPLQQQQQQQQQKQQQKQQPLQSPILRMINILVASFTLLFCVVVLNLFSWLLMPVTAASSTSMTEDLQALKRGEIHQLIMDRTRPLVGPLQQSNNEFPDSSSPALVHKPQQPHGPPKLPQPAKRIPRPITLYNETLIDYYRWMHYLDQDPDVETYIQAESEYTAAWIAQSGIKGLQKQLDLEISQIQTSMVRQPTRGNRPFLDTSNKYYADGSMQSSDDGSSGSRNDIKKPQVEHLERTQFWDVDHWRYWLDGTVGDNGVYKRRPIPSDAYQRTMELARRLYMLPRSMAESNLERKAGSLSQSFPSQLHLVVPSRIVDHGKTKVIDTDEDRKTRYRGKTGTVGGCPFDPYVSTSDVQIVLDVNQLAKKVKRKGGAGQFSFGAIEIQPQHTSLRNGRSSQYDPSSTAGGGTKKETFLAYTYDVTGDERHRIRFMALPSTSSSRSSNLTRSSKECERRASPAGFLFDNWCETLDQGQSIMTLDGNVLKDAGAETRWVKLGQDLYLYFTRLDSKGLSKEVWRVRIDSLGAGVNDSLEFGKDTKDKPTTTRQHTPMLVPELVMREKYERNVLSISQTNDGRFLLVESSGQTNSHTYFLSVDSPEAGWHILRQPEDNVVYKVEHHSGYFYLRTNHNNAPSFKVLRIPVEDYLNNSLGTLVETPAELLRAPSPPTAPTRSSLRQHFQDEVVIAHDPNEYLVRFEVFVEHFVAWVWRDGLQEFRIFQAPRPCGGVGPCPEFPLVELQRVRPYDPETKVATVMPGNIRDEEERLFRDFYSTRLRYSNCSFVHPWALYDLEMHDLTPLMEARNSKEDDDKVRKSTRLVCQEPFPVGVRYGQFAQGSLQDSGHLPKDSEKEQELEMSRYKEVRIMVASARGAKNPHNQDGGDPGSTKVMIPISVVYFTYPDGDRFPRKAGFLTAYGAYGSMTSPSFEPTKILPLLRRGLVYIEVHPRGDGVMGPNWYTGGKAENKRNTFYDVEDVLLYLRDSGLVEPGGVVVQGRSAGGLVTGWIANRWGEATQPSPGSSIGDRQRNGADVDVTKRGGPKNIVQEMVKVVLAQVPFLDVIADMSDPNIPWVEYEWSEWGSPLQSRKIFEVMKAYSPYDRVRNQPYPAMMVMGGLADSRVSYAEPLKYVAKLRSIDGKTNDCQSVEKLEEGKKQMCAGKKETPLLLQMEDGGHFSGSISLWMAFALYHLEADKNVLESYLD